MAGFTNGALNLDFYPFTTSAGDNNNIEIQGSLAFIITSNNNDAITGIMPTDPTQGTLLFMANVHATNDLIVKHQSGSSLAGNRILTYSGADVTVPPQQTALMGYDVINLEWHLIKFA